MKYLIENGIEEVTKQSQQLAEKPRMMFLGYNADTKTYLCKCIGRLRHILGEDSGLTITNVYKRGYMLEDLDVF